jgi:hypothetical protein
MQPPQSPQRAAHAPATPDDAGDAWRVLGDDLIAFDAFCAADFHGTAALRKRLEAKLLELQQQRQMVVQGQMQAVASTAAAASLIESRISLLRQSLDAQKQALYSSYSSHETRALQLLQQVRCFGRDRERASNRNTFAVETNEFPSETTGQHCSCQHQAVSCEYFRRCPPRSVLRPAVIRQV